MFIHLGNIGWGFYSIWGPCILHVTEILWQTSDTASVYHEAVEETNNLKLQAYSFHNQAQTFHVWADFMEET